jgi:hypothetical protein
MKTIYKPIINGKVFVNYSLYDNGYHRRILHSNQMNCCFYCQKKFRMIGPFEQTDDHFFPKFYGFKLSGNLIFACKACNSKKSRRIPDMDEIIKFVSLFNHSSKRSRNHVRNLIVATKNGKPRFRVCYE